MNRDAVPDHALPSWDESLRKKAELLLEECVDSLNAGERVDLRRILVEYPDVGPEVVQQLRAFEGFEEDDDAVAPLGTLGDYTLRRRIGRGGMGVVYDAWQNSMDRRVALKVLPPGIAADERSFTRFMREAKTVGKLNHQNVVAVHAAGFDENTPYYSMLTGQSPRRLPPS